MADIVSLGSSTTVSTPSSSSIQSTTTTSSTKPSSVLNKTKQASISSLLKTNPVKPKQKVKSGVKPKGPRAPTIKMSQPSAHPNLKSYGMVTKLQTEGPDPTLPVGSVSDELRSERIQSIGSNRSLAVGPQRDLYMGTRSHELAVGRSASQGPDASLACGPNRSLAMGPQRAGIAV